MPPSFITSHMLQNELFYLPRVIVTIDYGLSYKRADLFSPFAIAL